MPLHADLYVDRINLPQPVGTETCQVCRVDSWEELIERLRDGRIGEGQCPHWPAERIELLRRAADASEVLPDVPSLDVPRPTEPGVMELNEPTDDSPVLITGNSQLTHDVLLAVLSTTAMPIWMAAIDTGGHTVDMSLVYKTLTAEAIVGGFDEERFSGRIVLPGLAEKLAPAVSAALGRPVEVGPICAAELPIFFAEQWAS